VVCCMVSEGQVFAHCGWLDGKTLNMKINEATRETKTLHWKPRVSLGTISSTAYRGAKEGGAQG